MEKYKNCNHALYEHDFSKWAIKTAELIRKEQFDKINIESVAEEIEAWHFDSKHLLGQHLIRIVCSLLKYAYAPHLKPLLKPSWYCDLAESRTMIDRILEGSPSLQEQFEDDFKSEYKYAIFRAFNETGIGEGVFPKECPWTLEQILDTSFFPPDDEEIYSLSIIGAEVTDEYVILELNDQRLIASPVEWYPYFKDATQTDKDDYKIIGNDDEVIWGKLGHNIITLAEMLRTK